MLNILIALSVYIIVLIFLIKKPGAALCYVLLFTSLNNMVLNILGLIDYRFVSGIFILILFVLLNFKPKIIYAHFKKNTQNPAFWGMMLLPAAMIFYIYLLGGVSIDGLDYSYSFISNTLLFFLVILAFTYNINIFNQFIDGILYFGVIFFVVFYQSIDIGMIYTYDRQSIENTETFNAITLGRLAGIFTITGIFHYINSNKKPIKYISLILIFISAYWVLVTSTRQVIIGIILVVFIYFIISIRHNKKVMIYLTTGTIFSIILFTYFVNLEQFSILRRMSDLDSIENYKRYNDYIVALSLFKENLFVGLGPHGYQDIMYRYPHSYFLEMAANFGLIGIISFSMIVFTGFYYVVKLLIFESYNFRYHMIAVLWIFYFVSVMLSGDISINRHFWLLMGVLIIAYNNHKINIRKSVPVNVNEIP